MVWSILAAGSCHIDDVTTPHGRRERLQGGSVVYFTLAASPVAPVAVLGTVGRDAEASVRGTLAGTGADLSGLEVSELPTYHWHGTHDFETWIAIDDDTPIQRTCEDVWSPRVDPMHSAAPVLFVGSLPPRLQQRILDQTSARLVGVDTMVEHIEHDRQVVESVVAAAHVVFLNRTELAALRPGHGDRWMDAARSLCGQGLVRAVVVKNGPGGAALVTERAILERPAHPVDPVIDPTGAGDTFAGAFLAACAVAERDDDAYFGVAMEAGLGAAARNISAFGTEAWVEPVR